MKKYRRKIKCIEAIRYSGSNLDEVCQFIGISKEDLLQKEKLPFDIQTAYTIPNLGFYIPTKDNIKQVTPSNYITKDNNLELEVYSNEEFSSAFEEDMDLVTTLREQISNIRYAYNELHDDIEWAGLTESYGKASAVYRELEKLESIVTTIR